MADAERPVRQSVSIPTGIARRVRALAKTRKTSANRVLVDLIEAGLQSKEAEKERFFSLVNRFTESREAAERQRLKDELAGWTFGSRSQRFGGQLFTRALDNTCTIGSRISHMRAD